MGEPDFIKVEDWSLPSSTLTKLMTHKNPQGETILQEKTLNKRIHQLLLSIVISSLNESLTEGLSLMSEVRREIVKVESAKLLDDNNMTGPTIAALISYQDEANVPILQDENLSETSYDKLISLALSVLASVPSDNKSSLYEREKEEKEETKRLKIAAKILPELINYRPKEEESINRLSNIFKALKEVISKERNKEVKKAFKENLSFPSDIREALGLKSI